MWYTVQLLEFEPQKRLCTLSQLQKHSYLTDVNLEAVLSKKITPPFVPSVSIYTHAHAWTMHKASRARVSIVTIVVAMVEVLVVQTAMVAEGCKIPRGSRAHIHQLAFHGSKGP